jgi:uncharacterized phage protein (TIGR02220 family)
MSMMLMAKAFGVKVGCASSKLVLLKLADNANDQGECWPSYRHIADQCEMSRRSAMNHIDALCESGFIEKRTRKGPKGNSSNVYIVVLDRAKIASHSANSAPPPSATVSPPSENFAPPPSANSAPGISHSFEPVIEPKDKDIAELKLDPAADAITHLNLQARKNYRPVQSNTRLINARLKEGATIHDITAVIDRKCAEWMGNPKMEQYLRPSTLFSAQKFNDYLGQLGTPLPANDGDGNETYRASGQSATDRLTRQLTDLEYARENF